MARLGRSVADRERRITELSERRVRLMTVLGEHGALEEFQRLQELHNEKVAQLERVRGQLEQLRGFETNSLASGSSVTSWCWTRASHSMSIAQHGARQSTSSAPTPLPSMRSPAVWQSMSMTSGGLNLRSRSPGARAKVSKR